MRTMCMIQILPLSLFQTHSFQVINDNVPGIRDIDIHESLILACWAKSSTVYLVLDTGAIASIGMASFLQPILQLSKLMVTHRCLF